MQRILIVDDDKEMVNAIRRVLLATRRFEVDSVYDGTAAFEKVEDFKPELILLDMRMPGMDGLEFCQQLRMQERFAGIKVVVVSGALDMDLVGQFMSAGANDYLTKPFRNEFLIMVVEKVLKS